MGNFGATSFPGGIGRSLSMHQPWMASEVERLLQLRDEDKLAMHDVADELGRSIEECEYRYRLVKESHHLQANIRRRSRRPNHQTLPEALQDRDTRIAARCRRDEDAERTGLVTGMVFGDPPPGFSALDRRRA